MLTELHDCERCEVYHGADQWVRRFSRRGKGWRCVGLTEDQQLMTEINAMHQSEYDPAYPENTVLWFGEPGPDQWVSWDEQDEATDPGADPDERPPHWTVW